MENSRAVGNIRGHPKWQSQTDILTRKRPSGNRQCHGTKFELAVDPVGSRFIRDGQRCLSGVVRSEYFTPDHAFVSGTLPMRRPVYKRKQTERLNLRVIDHVSFETDLIEAAEDTIRCDDLQDLTDQYNA
ncbi:hypothetical protein HOLleu_04646 [Holothuria leucospilota]|uniref:Uncharacterized protein n=1 Tax=Holothuria leucospilota TaxID=206669 RepID=A0A9Q1HME7_HOLLE|nr:hypothetical protein HOLleu_04646 [Holothuria leucospilota]